MTDETCAYADWIRNLIKTCLPIDLQKKILTLAPLTKKEAEKFAHAIQLAAQAKQLSQHSDISEKLDALFRDSRRNGDLLRETLWHASGKLPQYKPTDGRSIGVIKEGMVQTAIERILGGKATSPRAIVNSVLGQYKDIPGAYNDLESFMKQVIRVLKKSGHSLKDMS